MRFGISTFYLFVLEAIMPPNKPKNIMSLSLTINATLETFLVRDAVRENPKESKALLDLYFPLYAKNVHLLSNREYKRWAELIENQIDDCLSMHVSAKPLDEETTAYTFSSTIIEQYDGALQTHGLFLDKDCNPFTLNLPDFLCYCLLQPMHKKLHGAYLLLVESTP